MYPNLLQFVRVIHHKGVRYLGIAGAEDQHVSASVVENQVLAMRDEPNERS